MMSDQRNHLGDVMRLCQPSGAPAGQELVGPDDPSVSGREGVHGVPILDDSNDSEGLVISRMPRLPPEPSARQIAEHEVTGPAVHRKWCRRCVAREGTRRHTHPRKKESCPTIGVDYGFFGRDKDEPVPILRTNAETMPPNAPERLWWERKVRLTTQHRY